MSMGIYMGEPKPEPEPESKHASKSPSRSRTPLAPAPAPEFRNSVKLKYVKLGYHYLTTRRRGVMYLFLFLALALSLTLHAQAHPHLFIHISTFFMQYNHNLVSLLATTIIICSTLLFTLYFLTRPPPVYLVDFACYKPQDALKCTNHIFMHHSRITGAFTDENLHFQKKILEKSGLGDSTYLPQAILNTPPNPSMKEARKEAEADMFGAIDQLLANTSIKPRDIAILIVNCSLFNPTPSLSAMVVNHYKLRGNILSYNLGGMGCSAGLISIDLASHLLRGHPNSYALVVTMENITLNWYLGNDRSKLVSNCLFRMGGSAILLSNKLSDRCRSKYQLVQTVRTHQGADDSCFSCITQEEDETGKIGVTLSRELKSVARDALKTNITTLAPLVLPLSEQLFFFASLIGRRFFNMKLKPYVPDFKLAFNHFCIHAGGRAVLDEVEKTLQLSDWHMEPSRMTLYRFGNTSSSSPWYELAYTEAKGRIKRGDRTWQIAFGSGFKCNSAVWRALRTIDPAKEKKNPWIDEIDRFPVQVPKIAAI